jgi:RHS repeat-associated protein
VWALADNQGTVKDLVDNNGVVVNHITYDSFGKVVGQTNASVGFRYGYTGREQDGETGLDYYRARYYDAGNGRFLSEDPIGFGAGDNNLYRYVGNSPFNGTDPSGLITFIIPGRGGEFGNLSKNILLMPNKRYLSVAISNPDLTIFDRIFSNPGGIEETLASTLGVISYVLGSGLGKDEPIILIAHSDGNRILQPIITAIREAQSIPSKGFGQCLDTKQIEIDVMQLDGAGVSRPIGANKVIRIGSNNPTGKGTKGLLNQAIDVFNASPQRDVDVRAMPGVSHLGLLNDREVLLRAQRLGKFKF